MKRDLSYTKNGEFEHKIISAGIFTSLFKTKKSQVIPRKVLHLGCEGHNDQSDLENCPSSGSEGHIDANDHVNCPSSRV